MKAGKNEVQYDWQNIRDKVNQLFFSFHTKKKKNPSYFINKKNNTKEKKSSIRQGN
jgi:hypothetical protein